MNYNPLRLLAVLAAFSTCAHSANIVLYLAAGSKSHKIVFVPYANELVKRGHHVTMISSFALPPETQKYEDIVPKQLSDLGTQYMGSIKVFQNRVENPFFMLPIILLPFASTMSCEVFLSSPEAADLVEGRRNVDLVIMDPLANDCALGLAHIYQAPVMVFSTTGLMSTTASAMGLPSGALFSPSLLVNAAVDVTCLWHRTLSVVSEVITTLVRRYYVQPKVRTMWEERVGKSFPSFEELERNTSLVLLNTHPAVDFPAPMFPSMIQVGGVHLVPPKPLPKGLQEKTKSGFVLFSLGSVTQAKDMPQEYFDLFVETFRKLPYNVFWKFESEEEVTMPPNVHATKWLPQRDLLGKSRGCIVTKWGILHEHLWHNVTVELTA